ncbi:protein-serine,threonine phosphatase [Sarracenia purpurea var. burkii]
MVSKIIKKTPTKTTGDQWSRRRKKSPIKSVAAVSSIVVASINRSFNTCHRRLIKIFNKFAQIGTPTKKKKKNPKRYGYQILRQIPADDGRNNPHRPLFSVRDHRLLPPLVSSDKQTIFLDVDETLVHSKPNPAPEKYDFVVRPIIDGVKVDFYVLKRPFVDELLEFVGKRFEVVIFTAGLEEYASLILDRLDRKAVIKHRLYRDSCREVDGKYVKDLAELGRDLRRVVIVDDNPNSYALQPENAIPIRPFTDDLSDAELRRLMEFLDQGFDGFEDTREAVKQYLADGNEDKKL